MSEIAETQQHNSGESRRNSGNAIEAVAKSDAQLCRLARGAALLKKSLAGVSGEAGSGAFWAPIGGGGRVPSGRQDRAQESERRSVWPTSGMSRPH